MPDETTRSPQQPLAQVVERLPVIVFRLDRHLRLLYVNEAVTEILGPQPEN
jgi:PAS domain-containing protein